MEVYLDRVKALKEELFELSNEVGNLPTYEDGTVTFKEDGLAFVQLFSSIGCAIAVLELAEELR